MVVMVTRMVPWVLWLAAWFEGCCGFRVEIVVMQELVEGGVGR